MHIVFNLQCQKVKNSCTKSKKKTVKLSEKEQEKKHGSYSF